MCEMQNGLLLLTRLSGEIPYETRCVIFSRFVDSIICCLSILQSLEIPLPRAQVRLYLGGGHDRTKIPKGGLSKRGIMHRQNLERSPWPTGGFTYYSLYQQQLSTSCRQARPHGRRQRRPRERSIHLAISHPRSCSPERARRGGRNFRDSSPARRMSQRNVLRGDGRHLLEVCRERARWIDDSEPSMGNFMFRIEHLMGGLEETERAESETLVKLVTEAIKGHTMCRFCKGRNQAMGWSNVHLSMANMADIQAQAQRPPSSP